MTTCRHCLGYLDRIDELEETVRQLEQRLYNPDWTAPVCLRLTKHQGRLVGAMMARDVLTKAVAMDALYGDQADAPQEKILDVMVCHARKRLRRFGLSIETVRAVGWRMSPEDKARLEALREPQRMAAE